MRNVFSLYMKFGGLPQKEKRGGGGGGGGGPDPQVPPPRSGPNGALHGHIFWHIDIVNAISDRS